MIPDEWDRVFSLDLVGRHDWATFFDASSGGAGLLFERLSSGVRLVTAASDLGTEKVIIGLSHL